MSKRAASSGSFRILGIEIDRKINLFAVTGFVLSVIALTSQVSGCLKGADISIAPPEQVVIFFDTYPDKKTYLRVAAQMSYVNSGAPEYVGIIKRETVDFKFAGKSYRHYWQSFERLDREGAAIKFYRISDVQPVTVSGGKSVSHPTVFGPIPENCNGNRKTCDADANFIKSGEFLNKLAPNSKLGLTFTIYVLGRSEPLTASCSLDLPVSAITLLLMNNWYAGPCHPAT